MVKKIAKQFFLCLLVLNLSTLLYAQTTQLPGSLLKLASIEPTQAVIILFLNPGDCKTCTMGSDQILISIASHFGSKIKLIAAIRGSRNIDVAIFKRDFNWPSVAILDDGTLHSRLGMSDNIAIAIYNVSHHLIYSEDKNWPNNIDLSRIKRLLNDRNH